VLLDEETIHVPSHSGRLSAYGRTRAGRERCAWFTTSRRMESGSPPPTKSDVGCSPAFRRKRRNDQYKEHRRPSYLRGADGR
jgi:hypothetical protein